MAAGAVVDAVSDVETVAPDESFGATVRMFLAHPAIVKVTNVSLRVPGGWTTELAESAAPDESSFMARMFRERPDRAESFTLTVPADAQPTQPYWLATPREGAMTGPVRCRRGSIGWIIFTGTARSGASNLSFTPNDSSAQPRRFAAAATSSRTA
jgi:hypothetical protein